MSTAQLVAKWRPLMVCDTHPSAELLAGCFERDVAYLNSITNIERPLATGPVIRYFSIIGMVIRRLTVLDQIAADDFDEHVIALVDSALKRCIEVDPRKDDSYTYEALRDSPDLDAFGRRLATSYVSLQA